MANSSVESLLKEERERLIDQGESLFEQEELWRRDARAYEVEREDMLKAMQ